MLEYIVFHPVGFEVHISESGVIFEEKIAQLSASSSKPSTLSALVGLLFTWLSFLP
jgi:hypothetical protein